MKILVSIPAFNEARTIGKVIRDIHAIMQKKNYVYAIQVVDDGSKDNTAEIAKKEKAMIYIHPKNYGLAETFRTEVERFLKTNATIFVHIDADGQYLPEQIPRLIDAMKDGNDLVLGSRFKGKIESMPALKRMGNKAFSVVVSYITQSKVSDAQTGFRAFNKKVASDISLISTYTYTQEQIIRAVKQKMKVAEVPVYFAARDGKSRLMKNPIDFAFKAGINLIRIMRDYAPLTFFGFFGALLIAIGGLVGLYLTYLFLTTGVIGRMPTIMLSVLLISIGTQIVFFGFLADMLKK